jgi:RNA polymerase sigma factor (sigma-70 family)
VITTATRDRFDAAAHAVWPLLVTRLRRAGASPEDAEDVAQEALLRAWDRAVHFVDDGDLLRWCTVVARRSHIDRVRRQARLRDLAEVASDSARRDLEAVELRHVLGTVTTALARLTEQERASLQPAPPAQATDRATQVRTAVARHRARCRLRLLVGPFAALVGQIARAGRRGVPAAVGVGALAAAVLSITAGSPHQASPAAAPPAPVPGVTRPVAAGPHTPPRLAPRPPAPPRRSAGRPSHARGNGPAVTTAPSTPIVGVDAPGNNGVTVNEQDEPDPHWFCVDGTAFGLGKSCVH